MSDGDRSDLRWLIRMMTPRPRTILYTSGIVATIAIVLWSPRLAGYLDGRGLPGDWIALGLIALVAVAILWALSTLIPSARRRRAVSRWARTRDAEFRSAFTLPTSLQQIPSLRGLGVEGGVANLVVVRVDSDEILVFDRWRATAVGYESAEWRTAAALRVPLDLPAVVIHPRHHAFRLPKDVGSMSTIDTESEEFHRRFHLLGRDRAGVVALLDARLMAWLLDGPQDLTFEATGAWLMSSKPIGAALDHDRLVEAVIELRSHLPRVSRSFYPPTDPGFGRATTSP
jgi:hypothetical protein